MYVVLQARYVRVLKNMKVIYAKVQTIDIQ